MLKVDNKMEELFLSDSVPKNLTIEFEDELNLEKIKNLNLYFGDIRGNSEAIRPVTNLTPSSLSDFIINNTPTAYNVYDYHNVKYFKHFKYIYVSFDAYISQQAGTQLASDLSFYMSLRLLNLNDGSTASHIFASNKVHFNSDDIVGVDWEKYKTFKFRQKLDISGYEFLGISRLGVHGGSITSDTFTVHLRNMQVRLQDNEVDLPYIAPQGNSSEDIDKLIISIPDIKNEDLIQESFSLTESLCSQDNLKFGLCESAHCEFEVVGRGDKFIGKTIRPYINIASEPKQNRIPLGVFKVTDVKKNHTHDIIKKSITAYDRMSILDQDVGDWLTRYMVITDTGNKRSSASPSFTKSGVEYVRQMFSTYVSLMIRLGILSQDDFSVKHVYKDENFNDVNSAGRYSFNFFYPCEIASGTLHETVGCTHALGDGWDAGSPSDEYFRVTVTPRDGKSDEELFNQYMGNLDDWPKSYVGFPNSACILVICEFIDGSTEKYLLNSGDIVYIKKGYKNLTFYIGAATGSFDSQSKFEPYNADSYIISHYKIESVYVPEDLKELVNAHLRLVYYNYGTQSLGSFSSSVSGKDVVRSLLEINGCFFHMNRYGKPEIIYASKAGLYPSEKLYPREDLYPRGMNGPLLSMSRYISMECDDYVVENYGKIQIKTQSRVKNGESICSYEYIGNPDGKNTYIIEDNIFYCAEGTVYEYGSQPEVDEMLKNLFDKISNLTYTPHTTKLRGLPFMECGDRVNLITKTGGIESFIFRRTLKGIHALMDTYEASGDEYNEALNTFDYKVYTPT